MIKKRNDERILIYYGGLLRKCLVLPLMMFHNIIIAGIPFLLLSAIVYYLAKSIADDSNSEQVIVFLVIFSLICLICFILLVLYLFFRKEYILITKNILIIQTNMLDSTFLGKCFLIDEISECKMYDGKTRDLLGRGHGLRTVIHYSAVSNTKNTVVIIDCKSREWLFAVEHPSEFIHQLNELIKSKNSTEEEFQSE